MTGPRDSFLHARPQTGRGLHTQESGEAGLSSNMEHKFNDNLNESALPVEEKGSSVIPIPKENPDIGEYPAKTGKPWHAAGPKAHPVSAGKGFIGRSTVVQTNNFPPQTLSQKSPEEEPFKVLPATAANTEEQSHEEVVGEGSCNKMGTGSKCPPLAPGAGRTSPQRRKRAAGKYRKLCLLGWMAFMLVPVSQGFPGRANPAAEQKPTCFTCEDKDKDRCPKLMNIFDRHDDTTLYQRGLKETFPECSVTSSPQNKSCSVCHDQSRIVIFCSEDVGPNIDAADTDGHHIDVISTICVKHPIDAHSVDNDEKQQTPPRTRFGLICSIGLFGVLLIVVVYIHYKQKDCIERDEH
ncbi:hypothetical protein VZT92_027676 [Zoarces viviparus]|uniref:Uncharacterized protein n=1 Tax=Zoarces viviparus TaxID=48416 RepID=A0AAW1DVI9_ZOAVI